MGGFFLYPKYRQDLDLEALERCQYNRGFGESKHLAFGRNEVLVWEKQLACDLNYLCNDGRCMAFAIGTLVYKGKTLRDSLRALTGDYYNGRVAWDDLLGSFCVGFWHNGELTLLTDSMECQPVFVDAQMEVASSSFLALLSALPGKHRLNRLGFAEKVATGYIVGPDTLVDGICRVTRPMQESWEGRAWCFAKKPPRRLTTPEYKPDKSACIDAILGSIGRYLDAVRAMAANHPVILGLSSGYDSRLLLASAWRIGFPLTLQTHATKGTPGHEADLPVVRSLAARKRVPLVVVPTRPMEELPPDEFSNVLRNCVSFFDARCSDNMGAFSETYTREYSIASLGDCALRLNGLGGEIYRNYYFDSPGPVNFRAWLEHHVYYPTARRVIADRGFWEEMHRHKVAKMSKELGVDLTERANALIRKRYYSEIRMPQCDGANNNAHNQVAFYLTPFIEWPVIRTGYQAVSFLGFSGHFQASLIERAEPEVAAAPSHYGFLLSHEPVRHRIKSWLKCNLPDAFWVKRRDRQLESGAYGADNFARYQRLRQRYAILEEVEEAQRAFVPAFHWQESHKHYANGPTCTFLGTWLREYAAKLKPW